MYNKAGFLYGNNLHYVDHIAILCDLLEIPLFITDDSIQTTLVKYYPKLTTKLVSPTHFSETILSNYDVVFSCLPKQLINHLFFFDEHKLKKKLLTVWLPHGNSDKDNLSALIKEDLLLIYGKQMQDTLLKAGLLSSKLTTIGNFRSYHYTLNKPFYEKLLSPSLAFSKKQKTIFYAPTWSNSCIEKTLPQLLSNFPSHYNLYIKTHPNIVETGYYIALMEKYITQPNIKFIDAIPTIYPILEKADIYLSDHSSIAYDFLFFNRPLFFLTGKKTLIHHTGEVITLDSFFEKIDSEDNFAIARHDIYQYCFDQSVHHYQLKQIIDNTINTYFETQVHNL